MFCLLRLAWCLQQRSCKCQRWLYIQDQSQHMCIWRKLSCGVSTQCTKVASKCLFDEAPATVLHSTSDAALQCCTVSCDSCRNGWQPSGSRHAALLNAVYDVRQRGLSFCSSWQRSGSKPVTLQSVLLYNGTLASTKQHRQWNLLHH